MDLIFIGDDDLLADLCTDLTQSPEDFLIFLENALESGELTLGEVAILISDYNSLRSSR